MRKTQKLLFIVNVDWFFVSHRLPIAMAALERGYEVHIATGITDKLGILQSNGLLVHPLMLGRSSMGVLSELRTFWQILRVFKRVRPDIVHLVTIKPVLLGGIAARLMRTPAVVAAISGLGFVFIAKGKRAAAVRFIVSRLYRLSLGKRNLKVICQNPDDCETLKQLVALPSKKVTTLSGSGVNLSVFQMTPAPQQGPPVVVMAARLLRDKGVREFVAAARLLKQREVDARFWLVGAPDPENPTTITHVELSAWEKEGDVELLGFRDDIPWLFSQATIVVLPSYYGEGLPKTLIEAAACGRAVVTTDHPGCRDAIEPGKSGLLVPVKDPCLLADAIARLLDDRALCYSMGEAGRALAERRFSIEQIVDAHLKIYEELEAGV